MAHEAIELRKEAEERLLVKQDDGSVLLSIPQEVKQMFNVLAPTAVMAAADPNFRPSLTVVELDTDDLDDFYVQESRWNSDARAYVPTSLSLSKNGILKLADAAGVSFDADRSGGKEFGEAHTLQFGEGKSIKVRGYKYTAVGKVRKSDGTYIENPAEIEWNPQVELFRIEEEVDRVMLYENGKKTNKPKFTGIERAREVEKRFIRSLQYRAPMCKSKAQSAVMRSLTKMKGKYAVEDASKPFLVVGFNYAPDYSDPRSAEILAGLVGSSMQALYGADAVATAETSTVPLADEDAEVPDEVLVPDDIDGEPYEEETEQEPEPEPEPEPKAEVATPDDADLDAVMLDKFGMTFAEAAAFEIDFGKHGKGGAHTLDEIYNGYDAHPNGDKDWLEWCSNNMNRDLVKRAVNAYLYYVEMTGGGA